MTPWSESQRRMLVAMGYTPWRRASASATVVDTAAETATTATKANVAPAAAGGGAHARLWAAIQRAAAGADVAALVGDLDALRRDPLRKRALWPKLRALRRPG